MFCPKCGAELPDGSRFCGSCGSEIQIPLNGNAPNTITPDSRPHVVGEVPIAATKTLPIIPVVALVAALAIGAAAFATAGFGLLNFQHNDTPAESIATSSKDEDITSSDEDGDTSFEANEPTEKEVEQPISFSVAVKDSVNDYSWKELSDISSQMSQAGSDDEAIEIAKKYHLCLEDGTLDGTQIKDVSLGNGVETSVQIIGFRHDDIADGPGKAGITFLFTDVIAFHWMNPYQGNSETLNVGGWRDSDMRTWLGEVMDEWVPVELAEVVVPVTKWTNNVGMTDDPSTITHTNDSFWLLSEVEIFGVSLAEPYNMDPPPGNIDPLTAVLLEEGSPYKLYRDTNVSFDYELIDFHLIGNSVIYKRSESDEIELWWLRSPMPLMGHAFYFVDAGSWSGMDCGAPDELGVVPAFAI